MRDKLSWIVVVVVSMALGGAAVVGIESISGDSGGTTVIERVSQVTASGVSETSISNVADLYEKVRPSVVQINGQSTRNQTSGLGSGIVLDKEGRILTNNHVVAGFDQVDVVLADGTQASAKVVGTDPGNDIAVLDVDLPADKLRPATLGDSTKVRVGEFVIAVGNPFGIEGSLTQGIVSGVGRTLTGGAGGRPLRQLIQSDAAINPGNSGGALFNSRGEVIGITTAIENPSGDRVFVGIGYAVPINTAARFLPDLLAGRAVQHPRMGVGLQNLTPALANRLGVSINRGVLITTVEAGSAAARAGLRGGTGLRGAPVGDIVLAIDGKDVKMYDELANYIDSRQVGDKVLLKIFRDGREQTLEVTLEAWRGNSS